MHLLFVHQNCPRNRPHRPPPGEPARLGVDLRLPDASGRGPGDHQDPVQTGRGAPGRRPITAAGRSRTASGTPMEHSKPAIRLLTFPGPDLIVGHSGLGSTLFLPELFPAVPVVNYFEYYYRPHGSDMDFRPDFPPPEDRFPPRGRNAMLLLDLVNCRSGYSPTHFQRSLFPAERIDRGDLRRHRDRGLPPAQRCPAIIGGRTISGSTRVVTYVSRGFRSDAGSTFSCAWQSESTKSIPMCSS